jgi:apolipoprotein N-acyltransferase
MTGIVKENTNSGTYFNSILLIDNKHRFYNKHHLVPFGEYLPLRKILYHPLRIFNIPISNFSSGKYDEKNLQTSKGNFGMSICYEDAYGNEVRRSMPDANILINVSNDAWFGNSMAPHQHLQIARMRAIENGRYFLSATNNGISAIIDNRGKIISRSPQFEKHVLNSNVALFTGATPYSEHGNMPLLIFFVLFILIYIIKRKLF